MTKVIGERAPRPAPAGRIGVLVLGMHRSGTSALSRVLSLLGSDLPNTLMGASPTNEAGHWESSTIMRLNDEILTSAGSNWHDWLAFNKGWHDSPKAPEFKERALAAVAEEFGNSRLFVLKDPRICRFAPFWLDVLETADVRPAVIIPVRNPLEVAASLHKRDGMEPGLGHLLWLRHVLEAEAGTRGLPRFHTSYDALLRDWPRLISATQKELGLSWPRLSDLVSEEIGTFLTERLRHHHEAPKSVSDNPLLSAWLRETFEIFSRWAEEGETAADQIVLDRIRAELEAAAPAFARLVSAGQQSAKKAKSLEDNLKAQQAKLEGLAAEHSALVEAKGAMDQQLAEAQTALSASQAAIADRDEEIAQATKRLAEARAELADMQAKVETLRSELDETKGQLSHTQSALAQRSAEADEATEQLTETRARLAERSDEVTALNNALRNKEAEAAAAIESARAEKQDAERRLSERFSEIAVMTRLLGEREQAARLSEEQAAWLRDVSAVLMNGSTPETLKGRLAALLPASIRLKKQKAQLKKKGIFDPDAYLVAYPDVAEAGIDPLWHYINHGMGEGRQRG